MRDPRIIAQSSDPRFAQQNPRMVRIRTLRITYIRSHDTHWPHALITPTSPKCHLYQNVKIVGNCLGWVGGWVDGWVSECTYVGMGEDIKVSK